MAELRAGLRVVVAAVGWPGHLFPALALARELGHRGHDVVVETFERWREVVEEVGIGFTPAEEKMVFSGLPTAGEEGPTLAEAARTLATKVADLRADLVVSDLFTLAPALAAEVAGVRRASLIPHPYPVQPAGLPRFTSGLLPPRSSLGAGAWRALRPLLELPDRSARADLNATRAELGLPRLGRSHAAISDGLALVATFPQLEYPRQWAPHVHVTGPLTFELPHSEVELPGGDAPLVLVAASTAQDPELKLVHSAIDALGDQHVRLLVTLNRAGEVWSGPVADNTTVVDWVSYTQVMPRASLVVCSGGHGTIARALADGVPVVVCPRGGDMAENGARVAWAGAGLMLPRRLHGRGPLRSAVRRVLADERYTLRAQEIASWGREHDAAARASELVERFATAD